MDANGTIFAPFLDFPNVLLTVPIIPFLIIPDCLYQLSRIQPLLVDQHWLFNLFWSTLFGSGSGPYSAILLNRPIPPLQNNVQIPIIILIW